MIVILLKSIVKIKVLEQMKKNNLRLNLSYVLILLILQFTFIKSQSLVRKSIFYYNLKNRVKNV